MEIEPSRTPPMAGKNMWNIVKIVFYMLRNGLSKAKLKFDVHLLFKQGKVASKALSDVMLHHHAAICSSTDVAKSFVSPRYYEFSCSNSPLIPRRKYHRRRHDIRRHHRDEMNVAREVFDEMSSDCESGKASPAVDFPGFGRSPVRQLRVTDSPFSIKDMEENSADQVDKAAEEFIKKFYKELEKQRILESPYGR